ncbi:protein FAM189B [Protopterus annectens]|uniref:protein FAM189B n=1 Tax=Protopterus annectens TaxID=7888 RepID=UPI001CFB409B|nr:protein FAM189B [Protopterus annectens]
MPSPSDSSRSLSPGTSRSLSRLGVQRARSQLLLALGFIQMTLGFMIIAFSFVAVTITASVKIRQSCPSWAGFLVVLSGMIGILSWKRPFTLVMTFFMVLSAICVILSLAGAILTCQNAQLVKSLEACETAHKEKKLLCVCCESLLDQPPDCNHLVGVLTMYPYPDCWTARMTLKDLLFGVCGLSILSAVICTLSSVVCCIQIFSLDVVHILVPQRSRSLNPECITPPEPFLQNMLDFDEFIPPVPPPPYYPPEYTCSSETDAQSITYNGSMDSPVPLHPTDLPPSYEAVMGQRSDSQATLFDAHAHVSRSSACERITSTVFSGDMSMDSGSLMMSEMIDMPDDSSPSEDSCLLEVQGSMRSMDYVLFRSMQRSRADYCLSVDCIQCGQHRQSPKPGPCTHPLPDSDPRARGERSYSCSTPSACYDGPQMEEDDVTRSCNRLETIGQPEEPCIPEIRVRSCTPRQQSFCSEETICGSGSSVPLGSERQCPQRRYSENSRPLTPTRGLAPNPLMRSHSDPGLTASSEAGDCSSSCHTKAADRISQSSTETAPCSEACLLPVSTSGTPEVLRRRSTGKSKLPSKSKVVQRLSQAGTRSLGDLKVCRGPRVLVAKFLQKSKRNLAVGTEHAGSSSQSQKRKVESGTPLEQMLRNPWHLSRVQQQEGIHLRSCGDLSSTSSVWRLLSSGGMEHSRPHSYNGIHKETVL